MSIEAIKTAIKTANSCWAKLIEFTSLVSHFKGNAPSNAPYKQVNSAIGSITLICSHPDYYGNEWAKTSYTFVAMDILKIFEKDQDLADRFFWHYRDMLIADHDRLLAMIKEAKEATHKEIDSLTV